MAPQGALEYRTDLETGSVEALEQVETRKRKKENASLLDSRLCNPSRKVTATQFPALWKGLLPRFCLHPLLVLGQNKKGGGEWWRSRTPPLYLYPLSLYHEGQRDNTGSTALEGI